MSRVIAKDLVVTQARALKMPGVVRAFEAIARQAREEHWGYEEFLHEVLSAEQTSRRDSAVRHRLREARFPEMKTLDTFDFAATDGAVSPTQIAELARGDWITRRDNVIFAGPIGTGKTHLAIALGVEAARQRRRVLFARAADVVRSLLEARDARELGRLHRRLYYVELLVLDSC
jgi:DNA replication protein DnaC